MNEVHWAESFGISRGPIREAARELEGQGFLVSRINQGFYVANFTAAEIRDIYEAKDWMEAAFISDLAAHTDAATRKSVLADIDSIEGADRVEFNETLFQFRVRMSKHIHNRFLADLMLTLYRKFYILSALVRTPETTARQARILRSCGASGPRCRKTTSKPPARSCARTPPGGSRTCRSASRATPRATTAASALPSREDRFHAAGAAMLALPETRNRALEG